MENEQGLFDEIRFTDRGKSYIRTLSRVSIVQIVLVSLYFAIGIYYELMIMTNDKFKDLSFDYHISAYIRLILSIIAIIGNSFYLYFPIRLMKSLELKDEASANMAFGLFVKALIFGIIYYLITIPFVIWRISWDPWM